MIEVIKFGAEWCNPCKVMNPSIKKLKEKYNVENSEIQVTDIDIDMNPGMAEEHKIKNIPTTVFRVDGSVVKRVVGVLTYNGIEDIINEVNVTK